MPESRLIAVLFTVAVLLSLTACKDDKVTTPGTALNPTMANIWLYGQIWSRGDLTIGGVRFRNVVECMYLVDMGEAVATDENGNVTGTVHNYVYGTTHFAPGVGPIRGRERGRSAGDSSLQDTGPTINDYVMDVIGVAVAY